MFVVVVTWKKCSYYTYLFCCTEMDDCLSVQVLFELLVQIPVQLLLELEANWLDQNVNELEFELSRIFMKRPLVWKLSHILIGKTLPDQHLKIVADRQIWALCNWDKFLVWNLLSFKICRLKNLFPDDVMPLWFSLRLKKV